MIETTSDKNTKVIILKYEDLNKEGEHQLIFDQTRLCLTHFRVIFRKLYSAHFVMFVDVDTQTFIVLKDRLMDGHLLCYYTNKFNNQRKMELLSEI